MSYSLQGGVPDDLALLHAFVNSLDERRYVRNGVAHTGGDELATVRDLERWMRSRHLLGERATLDAKRLTEALELRRALRELLEVTPPDRSSDAGVSSLVNTAAAAFPLIVASSCRPASVRRSRRRVAAAESGR
jgi:putative stress-induced transcription regulator